MRKWLIVLAFFTMALTVTPKNASAQTLITFGGSSQNVIFTANGGGTATLGLGGTCSSSCTLSGPAAPSSSDLFSLVTTAPINVGVLGSGGDSTAYAITMGGATSTFTYTNSSGLLQGNVNWTGMSTILNQAAIVGTLTVTANSSGLNGNSMANLNIDFLTNGYGQDLGAYIAGSSAAGIGATLSGGELSPTPEPASMLLFGSGLLALGAALRRRLQAS